jgi:prepilin-type N-terminal cleavage/methylation domain-containing protein
MRFTLIMPLRLRVKPRPLGGACVKCPSERQASDDLRRWKRRRRGFTLVEVLAALAFMAMVIPVAVEGLRIANLAGQVGQRKVTAARIAERVMNELFVTGQIVSMTASGVVQEGMEQYEWTMQTEAWPVDAMRLVTVQVTFPVQGRDYDVRLSTLAPN